MPVPDEPFIISGLEPNKNASHLTDCCAGSEAVQSGVTQPVCNGTPGNLLEA
jgi:hypothetical protein